LSFLLNITYIGFTVFSVPVLEEDKCPPLQSETASSSTIFHACSALVLPSGLVFLCYNYKGEV